ncbi:putative nuclease HARBI1 [Merluccius polli]|uniref:Nuclease HARBI1 n=1 Tax=Merluccius polli TaxID=89951 RepID=A0AA47P218_MERPO|nr:putative nuclease HARBI1 [Merluccius polli]
MDALNDNVMVVRRVQAARIISRRYRLLRDPFRRYNAEQFRCRYRLSKRAVRRLIALLADQLGSRGRGNMPVPVAHMKVLLALRYFATGTFLRCCGDMINVHESTVCRVVHRVARAIAALYPNYIAMANEDEQRDISTAFYVHAGIPGVIAIVDCTHIVIHGAVRNPSRGYSSINTQMVCDNNMRIRNVVARWPGSVHDSRIFSSSHLKAQFEEGVYGGVLLGDRGYPLRRYLITPVRRPATHAEAQFNESHKKTRCCIERTFGVLKSRFSCLSFGLRATPLRASNIIVACAVLHNLAIDWDEYGVKFVPKCSNNTFSNSNKNQLIKISNTKSKQKK